MTLKKSSDLQKKKKSSKNLPEIEKLFGLFDITPK